MTLIRFTILTTAFAALVRGDHTVTFINDCNFAVTPMWKDNSDGASNHQISTLAPGASGSTSLPEFWQSGRLYAQDPVHSCALPDGGGCTLVECNFGPGNPRFWQCNLSLVSGYNLPTAYKFVGGNETSCTGFSCTSSQCPMTEAYLPSGCNGCINQCNTDNVGLQITYCQQGSTLPAFAPKPAPPKPAPAPAPPKSQPAPAPVKSQPAPAPPKSNPAPAPAKSNPAPAPNSSAPENVVAAPTPTASEAATPSAQPSSGAKHCPRSRRKARRAHKRRMHMLELGEHNA